MEPIHLPSKVRERRQIRRNNRNSKESRDRGQRMMVSQ